MCLCRFIDYNRCTILEGYVDDGELCICGSKGYIGNLSFNFCVNLKLPQTLKVFNLKKEQMHHIFYSKKWVIFDQHHENFGIPLTFDPALYVNHRKNRGK